MTENRFEKATILANQMSAHILKWYDGNPQEKHKFFLLYDAFADALERYLKIDVPWDSRLISVVGAVQNVRFKTTAISTDDSVMDRARELYVFIVSKGE